MTKQFNFNHEEHVTHFELDNETGRVSLDVQGETLEFDSVLELAEFYAGARGVTPDKLKNWTLIEDGDYYAYVLRAATAGNDFFSSSSVPGDFFVVNHNTGDDETEEEYDEYEEPIRFDTLSNEEQLTLLHQLDNTLSYEKLVEANLTYDNELVHLACNMIFNDQELYEAIKNEVEQFTTFGNGNFDLGLAVKLTLAQIDRTDNDTLRQLSEEVRIKANKQLKVNAIARRNDFQIFVCNIRTQELRSEFRESSNLFRETELVLHCAGRIVVFTV